jgi:hypothetical protein
LKTTKLIAGFSATLLGLLSTHAQGTFENLNFEKARPISGGDPYDISAVTAASALPAWTVTIGGVQQTEINLNDPSLGSPAVGLISVADQYGFSPIDGNYSVLLEGSFPTSTPSISQTGVIPTDTQSLLFEAQPGVAALEVLIPESGVKSAGFLRKWPKTRGFVKRVVQQSVNFQGIPIGVPMV